MRSSATPTRSGRRNWDRSSSCRTAPCRISTCRGSARNTTAMPPSTTGRRRSTTRRWRRSGISRSGSSRPSAGTTSPRPPGLPEPWRTTSRTTPAPGTPWTTPTWRSSRICCRRPSVSGVFPFRVPRGVYARFTATYGIHATLGSRCPILFEVYGDDRLLFRDVRCAGDPAGAVALAWPSDAEHLRLITTVPGSVEMPRINDRPIAPTGHAVWAGPVLTRETRRARGNA